MNDFLKQLMRWAVRLGLLAAALIFLASLLFAAGLLLMLWLMRALWAKLTGRPVQPWVFKMHRADLWQRAYRATAPGAGRGKPSVDVIDAEVTDVTDVSDVREKRP
ncbi:hypothetical protein [Rhodoferax sp.]|uniref:hypothetical protein n=1 Tax=Rhodoferax sp. TaxID=50421 RepID=UPI00271FD4CE|nr:hypothetical protein [Rhodoferax sp.]MDO9198582.1 hypothetical protein [Rhodoferax sp.]